MRQARTTPTRRWFAHELVSAFYPYDAHRWELERVVRRSGWNIAVAFELGSRDLQDAVYLSRRYGCHTHAFECNPKSRPMMAATLATLTRHEQCALTVVEQAVYHTTGTCMFRAVSGHPNIGASSLYRNVRAKDDREYYPQGEPIEVPCTRLDDYCRDRRINSVDLVWSDLQGADLMAVETLGELLAHVRVVMMEVEYIRIYEQSVIFDQVLARMQGHGFTLHKNMPVIADFGNAIFVRSR